MAQKIIIARHGNTFEPGDVVRRVGKTDIPLAKAGFEQGNKLGKYLKSHQLIPSRIYTSHYQRTQQTAIAAQAAMGTHIDMVPVPFLNEIDYGIDENKPESDVIARVGKEALVAWDKDCIPPADWKVNVFDILHNWQQFAAQLSKDTEHNITLIVTSNGIARFSPILTGNFDAFKQQHSLKIGTGHLCIFENTGDQVWECLGWNIKPQ